ncbi:type II secretion system protein GspG [bacterium]|nr:type II secretion system protein GspG [bacterium]
MERPKRRESLENGTPLGAERSARHRRENGFTLVEIMVVLVIIGLIGTFLFGKIFASGERAKARINEMKMKTLSQKIGEYKLNYNRLPGTLTDLSQCNEVTGQGCIPLLDHDDPALEDAWGNPFTYTVEGSGRTFRITSLGADGRPGGEGVNFDFNIQGP